MAFEFTPQQLKLLGTLVLMLGIWLVRLISLRLVNRRVGELQDRFLWRQIINYLVLILALFLLIPLWFSWFQTALTLLSVVAAAIVMVNKEILMNLFSYSIIAWRGLFRVGDRIQIVATTGDVVALGPMYISVAETLNGDRATGRIVKIPNKDVIDKHIINFSKGKNLVWNEMEVKLGLNPNWRKARELLLEILESHNTGLTQQDIARFRELNVDVMFTDPNPAVTMRVDGDKLVLTGRYLCDSRERITTADKIWTEVLMRFGAQEELRFLGKLE